MESGIPHYQLPQIQIVVDVYLLRASLHGHTVLLLDGRLNLTVEISLAI